MAYSSAQLILDARILLNEPAEGFWLNSDLTTWGALAAKDISTKARCVERTIALSVIPDLQSYAAPTGAIGIEAVALDGIPMAHFRVRQFGNVSSGEDTRPSSFAFFANAIHLFPIPRQPLVLAVLYWIHTDDLLLLPESYDNLVLLYVLRMARLKEQRYAEAAQLNSMYLSELQFQRNDLQDQEPDTKEKLRLVDRIAR